MPPRPIETFCPETPEEWRQWLSDHHRTKESIWLVYYKKASGKAVLNWSQAVDQALCFGWIDSIAQPIDELRYRQLFTRRKPGSAWSRINKDKVERLSADGLMSPAGLDSIATAQKNGAWTLLDEVESLTVPAELTTALQQHKGAEAYFLGLSKSVRKMMLQWVAFAKRPQTRQQRIEAIATAAAQQTRPKQFL